MTVYYVFINGSLSHSNGKLMYWSQLDNILHIYFTGVTSLSGVTTLNMIYKSFQQIETSTDGSTTYF